MTPEHTSIAPPQTIAGGESDMGRRAVLEMRVPELRRLFNTMDPSPLRERDLDPNAEEFILDWAQETRAGEPLGLVVQLNGQVTVDDANMLREAIHEYFRQRALTTRRQLRRLFRVGRISLLIGLAFLACAIALGEFIAGFASTESYSGIIKETFIIGGWVALWRPLEIFLYDWWPIRAEARLYDRLSEIAVSLRGATGTEPDALRLGS